MTVAAATAGREWLLDTILRNHGIKSRSAAAMLAPTLAAAAAAAVVRTAEVRRAEIITMMRSAVGRKQSQKQQWASIRRAVAVALVGTGVVALLAAAITIIAPFLLTPTVGALPAVLRVAVWAVNK
jgi:outer membrane receptor protein involved in Fe transport